MGFADDPRNEGGQRKEQAREVMPEGPRRWGPTAQGFPTTRMRRLREHPGVRELVRETRLVAANLVLPLFVRSGEKLRRPISAMPGHAQLSPDLLAEEVREAAALGLGGVILFGIPARKDHAGSEATDPTGIIPQAVRVAKEAAPELPVITEVG
jgi:porphobilinogen synthase